MVGPANTVAARRDRPFANLSICVGRSRSGPIKHPIGGRVPGFLLMRAGRCVGFPVVLALTLPSRGRAAPEIGGIRSVGTLVPRRDAGACDHRWCDRVPAARGDVPHLRADPLRDREGGPWTASRPPLYESGSTSAESPSSQVD